MQCRISDRATEDSSRRTTLFEEVL
jgi:hypothetical protein